MDSVFSLFDAIPVNSVSSDFLKDSVDKEYRDLFFSVVARIKPVLIKHICRVACSFGKDSNLVLSASLQAHKQAVEEGKIPKDRPFIVTHIDTGVDDIFIRAQVAYEVAELTAYCNAHGINLVYRSAVPPLRYSWAVMYLSGMKLPSFAKSSADCSVILKIDSARRLEKELSEQFGEICTILGVRSAESSRRSASIKRHHLDDVSLVQKDVNGKQVLTFAPIVDLSTEDVFAILRRSGTHPIVQTNYPIPTYKAHNKLLIKLYGDAQETCPVSSFQPAAESRSGSCGNGSRFGCFTCLKVVKDRSADARERYAQYDRVKYVKLIRDWMAHHADDMSTRSYVGKSLCSVTGSLVVQANTYSAQTLEKLIWWFAQATREDYLFVKRFLQLKAQNRLMEDSGYAEIANDDSLDQESRAFFLEHYVHASSMHLIQPLTIEHILMICAIHARDGVALPPYRALHIWDAVWKGESIDWPVIVHPQIVDPVPEPRFFFGNFKKTANAKLNFLLADELSCSTKTSFQSANGVVYTSMHTLTSDYAPPSSNSQVKHAFTRRKITKKMDGGKISKITRSRMSVNLDDIAVLSNRFQDCEKKMLVSVPTTDRVIDGEILVWAGADVESGFSIDHESLDMFLLTEYDRCLEKHDAFVHARGEFAFGGTSPFIEMVHYGLFKFTQKSLTASERMLARTEQLCFTVSGVSLLNMSVNALEAITCDQRSYRHERAKALLAIRAARTQAKRHILAQVAMKQNFPKDYLFAKATEAIRSANTLYHRNICEKMVVGALVKSGVRHFDGVSLTDYMTAIDFSISALLNKCASIDGILDGFAMDKNNVSLRKVASSVVDDFVRSTFDVKLGVMPESMWTVLASFRGLTFSQDDFSDVAAACAKLHGLRLTKSVVYQTKKPMSIVSLPIFGVAS